MKDIIIEVLIGALLGIVLSVGINYIMNDDRVSFGFDYDTDDYPDVVRDLDIDIDESDIEVTGYYYNQLDDTEKSIYRSLLSAVLSGTNYCSLSELQPYDSEVATSKLNRSNNALRMDHPELFWLTTGFALYKTSHDSNSFEYETVLAFREFWKDNASPQTYFDVLMKKVNEVVASATDLPSDYDKALYFYEYVIDNTYYDYDRLNESEKTIHDPECELIYTAYGCLVEGRAVCAGYASAYQLLLRASGINCYYVSGFAGERGRAWNCVQLDGDFYQTDPTWGDDAFYDDDGLQYPDTINYSYFCLTSHELEYDHTFNTSMFEVPYCISDKYNYYTYNGYILYDYSKETLCDILSKQEGITLRSVKIHDPDVYATAKNELPYDISDIESALGSDLVFYTSKRPYIYVINQK